VAANFFDWVFGRPEPSSAPQNASRVSSIAPAERQKAVSMMASIIKAQASQTRKDIEDWKQAKRAAENPDRPNRRRLMEIYHDAVIDGHLKAQINNRIMRVTNKKFKIINRHTKDEDVEKTALLQKRWFKDFRWYAMEKIFWGFSLVEFNPPGPDGEFKSVKLVYRQHVLPERLEVLIRASDDLIPTG
jgi:hypothetical protein